MADPQDKLSNEDLAALHEAWGKLQEAGDPRAEKVRQFIVSQGNSILHPSDNRGALSKAWDWANQGMISKDTIVRALSGRTPEELKQETEPSQWDTPSQAAGKAWLRGATLDTGETASSLTSPLSAGLVAAGGASSLPSAAKALGVSGTALKAANVFAKTSKAIGTAAGVGFIAKGGQQMNDAAQGPSTPENLQRFLQGGAMLAGGGAGTMEATANVGRPSPELRQKMSDTAPDLYRSALKPSTVASQQTKVNAAIGTGLEQGIPVSQAGIEKLGNLIDDANAKIKDTIAADPNRPISTQAVASRTDVTRAKFSNQVNPQADLAAIDSSKQEFLDSHPDTIAASDAQALKTGTYQQLKGKAYGELKSASIEAQKALARGLKEELANAFPELTKLNKLDSSFLNLDPILEKAVARVSNRDVGGIGTPIAAGAAKAVTGSTAMAAVMGTLKAVVDNPNVKSRLAIAMYKASKGTVTQKMADARIAAYSSALANAANAQPPDDQGQR